MGPARHPIALVIATAAPCSQSAFVTGVHLDTELQREMGASGMVRKGEYSVSGTALLHPRLIPGKKTHSTVPPASTTSPARNNLTLFLLIQFSTSSVFVTLLFSVPSGNRQQQQHRNMQSWYTSSSFVLAVFSDGGCRDVPCYTPLLRQASTFSKFQKLSTALPFEGGINYDENSSRANSSRCKTPSLFPFFKRYMK